MGAPASLSITDELAEQSELAPNVRNPGSTTTDRRRNLEMAPNVGGSEMEIIRRQHILWPSFEPRKNKRGLADS